MFILTTEKKLRSPRLLQRLSEGDTWQENIWPNTFICDVWDETVKRYPGHPWKHMRELYGRHEGETIIITGSGPSIDAALPILQATKHPIMAINRSIKKVPARYLLCHDQDAILELKDHPNAKKAEKIVCVQLLQYLQGFPCYAIEAAGSPSRWPIQHRPLYWNEITLGWAIHLGIRMGAKRIVTIGTDLSFGYADGFVQPGRDKDWLDAQHLGSRERTLEMFLKDKAEWYERPVEILDASGGAMPCQKVRLEDVV